MATTGFWPVRSSLGAVIRYADNPDKTTNPKYLDDDLAQVLRYAENDDKTDRRLFVTGIHCTAEHAYEDMTAVQKRFGLKGQIVAYHGYQSFKTGEVTPEEAHRIGIETAKEMWGDRFQVLVTTHLNTQTVHNHMIVNAVSYKDGKKFQNHIRDHIHLREISDRICRERQLSVLEDAPFYGGKSRGAYWAEKQGKLTHRAMRLRAGSAWHDNDYVFCNEVGEPLSAHTVYNNYKRIVASIGIPTSRMHDLRHSYAVAAIMSGDDIKTVQENLGHATAAFTLDRYGHVTEQMRQASAERMEQFFKSVSNQ